MEPWVPEEAAAADGSSSSNSSNEAKLRSQVRKGKPLQGLSAVSLLISERQRQWAVVSVPEAGDAFGRLLNAHKVLACCCLGGFSGAEAEDG
jgi:hypothetical protein